MSFDIDPSFRGSGGRARQRQMQRRLRRFGLTGVVLVFVFGISGWLWSRPDVPPETPVAQADPSDPVAPETIDGDFAMVQVESSPDERIIAAVTPFIDLRKDPMILNFEQSGKASGEKLAGPSSLAPDRVGPAGPDRITLISDELVLRELQLVTTIPSSREDLALFQASRTRGISQMVDQSQTPQPVMEPELTTSEGGDVISVDGADGSWGALIETSDQPENVPDQAVYVETRIENTTSVALIEREASRVALFDDRVIVLQTDRALAEVMTTAGLDSAAADRAATAATRLLTLPDVQVAGSVVALRFHTDPTGPRLLQMSIYAPTGYIGTLAQVGAGRFDTGADPWIAQNLMQQSDTMRNRALATGEVRLLDAVYSAAIRNGLPTTLVGELIVMLSQHNDLDRFAAVGDRLTILFATTPGPAGIGSGQVLYAGVRGPSGDLSCYVVTDPVQGGYNCFDASRGGGGGGSGGIGAGLIVPTQGTKTSGFGPRMHPILRQLRNHDGVDWAAPTGTPVMAAADGRISRADRSDSYGNIIYIDHDGGRQTRYAHMNGFAEGVRVGNIVKAGDLIGYIGTTGRSTGPHLHFELLVNGVAVDPLNYNGGGGSVVVADGGPGSDAVEALVNQIIAVESGGRADAANPLSSAVGLGQFIQSTWIRMMQTYRPDLVSSMSRQDLLNLRTNPELSREMVRNLARENEAYLRSNGHQITPGRLYLAHFLGPGGANIALRAAPERSVADVMGAGVVNANRFLVGKTIADLLLWSDRKMGSRTGTVVATAPARPAEVPAEIRAYIATIDGMIDKA